MKLSSIMSYNDSLRRKPSFLKESIQGNHLEDTPCNVGYSNTWVEGRGLYSKIFSFPYREYLKHFSIYVLDFESEFGVQLDITIESKSNEVEIKVPSYQVGDKIKSILSKIDAIYSDVLESYSTHEQLY